MKLFLSLLFIYFSFGCKKSETIAENISESKPTTQLIENPTDFYEKLSNAAISIIDPEVVYTPDYVEIKYPNGDVPAKTGVCTDVVIRSLYPNLKKWGLKTTDKNIDHRRVPNLEVFFSRKGKTLPITQNPKDYKIGDLVTWMIGDKLPHIGIVTHLKSNNGNPMIVHNVGSGQVLEDCLLSWKIVGHFRYNK